MKVVIIGDLEGSSSARWLMKRLANSGIEAGIICPRLTPETLTESLTPSAVLEDLIIAAPEAFLDQDEQPTRLPDKGNFRRQFGGVNKRLDRRFK